MSIFNRNKDEKNNKEDEKKKLSPKGKAALFFGCYFIFFLVLIMLIRNGEYIEDSSKVFNHKNIGFEQVEQNNYSFHYEIIKDKDVYTYDGDKLDFNEKFIYKDKDKYSKYLRKENIYYVFNGSKLIEDKNPYIYKYFYDIDIMKTLIENAKYIKYDQEENCYIFQITNGMLSKFIDNKVDENDFVNNFKVYIDDNNKLTRVYYELNNYGKFKNICKEKFSIDVKYKNFGNVSNINEYTSIDK